MFLHINHTARALATTSVQAGRWMESFPAKTMALLSYHQLGLATAVHSVWVLSSTSVSPFQ